MGTEAHLRIDEGIKRGPRKQVDRRPKAALNGQFLPKFTPEQKQAIIADTLKSLEAGETTEQIAARYGITGRAIRHWLLDDPQADTARRIMVNGELARTLDEMKEAKHADSPLPLACAREEFRAWSWIAERREYKLYGAKQEISVKTEPLSDKDVGLLEDASELLRLFKSKLIQAEPVANLPNAAVLTPSIPDAIPYEPPK